MTQLDEHSRFVWANDILCNGDLQCITLFYKQQTNQYLAPFLSMYSAQRDTNYLATFSGLSNLYYDSTGNFAREFATPYGNILDLLAIDSSGNVQEYANTQPMCSGNALNNCLYMGLTAAFIRTDGDFFDSRNTLLLDKIPQNTATLVGYLYGGLLSTVQTIFPTDGSSSPAVPTNAIYAVYINLADSEINWSNITNIYQVI